jgi:peptidoglycan/xylan/chitin deacetylase (PgdA/CDA1 family)
MSLIIPTYHYIRDFDNTKYPGIKGLDLKEFKYQINFLNNNYKILSPQEVKRKILEGGSFKDNECWLTFDDGYKDHFDFVRPILNSLGLKASFFPPVKTALNETILDVNLIHYILAVIDDRKLIMSHIQQLYEEQELNKTFTNLKEIVSRIDIPYEIANHPYDDQETIIIKRLLQRDLPEKFRMHVCESLFNEHVSNDIGSFAKDLYMNLNEIDQLVDEGHEIGSHGYNHCWLSSLTYKAQSEEIKKSIQFWQDRGILDKHWTICYPYGDFNEETIRIAGDCGALIGLTVENGIASMNNEDYLRLPRIDTNELPKR